MGVFGMLPPGHATNLFNIHSISNKQAVYFVKLNINNTIMCIIKSTDLFLLYF